jgi:hypothetical protein
MGWGELQVQLRFASAGVSDFNRLMLRHVDTTTTSVNERILIACHRITERLRHFGRLGGVRVCGVLQFAEACRCFAC